MTADPALEIEYRLFLDPNGFVIGFAALEDISKNYVYVVDASESAGDVEAKVLFPDGTVAKIDVNSTIESLMVLITMRATMKSPTRLRPIPWRARSLLTRRTARMFTPSPSRLMLSML